MSPRHVVALLATALLAAACTSEPSAADRSAASASARHDAVARTDLSEAVHAIKLCAQQNDGEYPPAVKNQPRTITMLCGPVSQTIRLTHGNRLTYRPRRGGFSVTITNPSGGRAVYRTAPPPSVTATPS